MARDFRIRLKAQAAAEIYLYGDVGAGWFDGVSAKDFADQLKALGPVDTIDVRINSYGGDVFDGLAIYNQLQTHRAKVTTYIDGIAASIASVIAMAGEEIHMAEAGFVMIHNALGAFMGNADELRQFADTLETVSNSLADVYIARTGQSANAVRDWMAAETWFNSTDALKNGFCTKLVDNMKVAAKYDAARHRFKHAPAAVAARPQFDAARDRITTQRARMALSTLRRSSNP